MQTQSTDFSEMERTANLEVDVNADTEYRLFRDGENCKLRGGCKCRHRVQTF